MRTILLKSSDDKSFEVKESIANHSVVLSKMLEAFKDSITIPIPKVKGAVLSKVIEWIVKHEEEQMCEEELRNWETEFVNMDLEVIVQVMVAADYLEVSGLFRRAGKKAADLIADKSPEEIRMIFDIENDFSPEEEAEIRRQNAWSFQSDATTSTSQ